MGCARSAGARRSPHLKSSASFWFAAEHRAINSHPVRPHVLLCASLLALALMPANARAQSAQTLPPIAHNYPHDLLFARDALIAASAAERPQVRADIAILMTLARGDVQECEPTLDVPHDICGRGGEPGAWDVVAQELARHSGTEPAVVERALVELVAAEQAQCALQAARESEMVQPDNLYDFFRIASANEAVHRSALERAFAAGGRARTVAAFRVLSAPRWASAFAWDLMTLSPTAIAAAESFRTLFRASLEHLTVADDPLARALRESTFSLETQLLGTPTLWALAHGNPFTGIVFGVSDDQIVVREWPSLPLLGPESNEPLRRPRVATLALSSDGTFDVSQLAPFRARAEQPVAIHVVAETTRATRLVEGLETIVKSINSSTFPRVVYLTAGTHVAMLHAISVPSRAANLHFGPAGAMEITIGDRLRLKTASDPEGEWELLTQAGATAALTRTSVGADVTSDEMVTGLASLSMRGVLVPPGVSPTVVPSTPPGPRVRMATATPRARRFLVRARSTDACTSIATLVNGPSGASLHPIAVNCSSLAMRSPTGTQHECRIDAFAIDRALASPRERRAAIPFACEGRAFQLDVIEEERP